MRKTLFIAALLLGLPAFTTGCNGVVKNSEEIGHTYAQVTDMDARQMMDDWNLIWLSDRQYRLTKWHIR